MREAKFFILTIFFLGCAFDDSSMFQKNDCKTDSDCLDQLVCVKGICRYLVVHEGKADDAENENQDELVCSQEICDGIDNDCDGKTDEDFNVGNSCAVGSGICKANGHFVCDSEFESRCNAEEKRWNRSPEICDNLDNDCDGQTDEDFQINETCSVGKGVCKSLGKIYCDGLDQIICNAQEKRWLITEEVCDGLDNDCDGETDENLNYCCIPGEIKICGVSEIGTCQKADQICSENRQWGECFAVLPSEEICDDFDNDCDGEIDEGNLCPVFSECESGQCTDFCQIEEYNGHTYAFCSQELDWEEAAVFCQNHYNGHLATISNQPENNFLQPPLFEFTAAWIGLYDINIETIWKWESQEEVTYYQWSWGEPNNSGNGTGEEDCVEIRTDSPFNGNWNDANCDLVKPFFCEWNDLF